MTEKLWAGVDVGTQSLRVCVVDGEGTALVSAAVPLASRRDGGRHEQDPHEWWDALCRAFGEVGKTLPAHRCLAEIAAIAFDTTSGTILLTDSDGSARTPALMYDDHRATALVQEVQDAGAGVWARLGYQMQAAWALPKLLWLQREGELVPGVRLQHSADFLASRLAGGVVGSDWSHALKTGFDLDTLTWPEEVFENLGLPLDPLPEVHRPGSLLGHVSAAAARDTGLREGVEIRAGMTDGCSAQIAAGALEEGAWNSVLGTTLVVKGVTPTRLNDAGGAIYSHRHPDGGWLPGGASSTGTGALVDEFGPQHYKRDAAAAAWEPSSGIAWPLRGHGERFPIYSPQARAFEIGPFTDASDRYAAWLQGIAFVERLAFEQLASLGAPIDGPLSFTGGAVRSGHFNQLRADVLNRSVRVLRTAEPSLGAALLALAGDGSLTAVVRARPQTGETVDPRADTRSRFDEAYAAFLDALRTRGWLAEPTQP